MSIFYNDKEEYNCPLLTLNALKNLYFSQKENILAISQKKVSACTLEQAKYPMLSIELEGKTYSSPVARPDLFEDYYKEECYINHGRFFVSKSKCAMPLAFLDETLASSLSQEQMAFRKINPLSIESIEEVQNEQSFPINWFNAPRVDYSLNRLLHYTGTEAEHFQDYIIFVNYQKYIPAFIEYAKEQIKSGKAMDLVGPDNLSYLNNKMETPQAWNDSFSLPQMPAYHIKKPGKKGITIINIGVGPSNAKTISDHLAVLRPRFCMMAGHCGSLKKEHEIGDYIIGKDHLMFDFNDSQTEMHQSSFSHELQSSIFETKTHVGSVVSTSDRNWELRSTKIKKAFQDFDAIGIDMESAMLVQILESYGIPCSSFLCISDKPLHREVRLQKMAKLFYKERIINHLLNSLKIIEIVAQSNLRRSRKNDSPLFR